MRTGNARARARAIFLTRAIFGAPGIIFWTLAVICRSGASAQLLARLLVLFLARILSVHLFERSFWDAREDIAYAAGH